MMADLLIVLSVIPPRVWWTIGAVLCIVGLVLGLNQHARRSEPQCRTCRYNNMGDCTCKILCEKYEMWESSEEDRK